MLRFANPGSDIDSIIRIFQAIYQDLQATSPFGIDDVSEAMVRRRLAASSGYVGEEALRRSTRHDRSRDPLYNQSKMYSEVFRMLGWLQSEPENRLQFRFSYLGAHVAEARRDAAAITRECLLGIAVPNPSVESKGDMVLRPFACILRTMHALDGRMCRDEMIIGPLSLANDRSNQFDSMVEELRAVRGRVADLKQAIEALEAERGITHTTMGNYTRFPLAVLEWSGWTSKQRLKGPYDRSLVFHELTEHGKGLVSQLEQCPDVRANDLDALSDDHAAAFSRLSGYALLERANFEMFPVEEARINDRATLADGKVFANPEECVFSPFQELESNRLRAIFPQIGDDSAAPRRIAVGSVDSASRSSAFATTFEASQIIESKGHDSDSALIERLKSLHSDDSVAFLKTARAFKDSLAVANQDSFYPLVASLFRISGFDCEHSRAGVNYQRADAFIRHDTHSMPIEIKSPGEEQFVSVKAIRQAIENKVILQARKPHPSTFATTSLVVGFNLPNSRAEVLALIDDVFTAFGINIGVIDLETLCAIALRAIVSGMQISLQDLSSLKGYLAVDYS